MEENEFEMLHVDIVLNDFSALEQRRVAVVRQVMGLLQVEYLEQAEIDVLESLGARVNGASLKTFADVLHGSVVAATAPHDSVACPYTTGNTIPFSQHDGSSYSSDRTEGLTY